MAIDQGVVHFDEYELDIAAVELKREGQLVAVEPQVFDVLCYLVAERDRVVPKTELLDNVWGDRFVSESALTSRIKSLRQAVGDDGRTQRTIRTAHGRGYQFVGRVHDTTTGTSEAVRTVTPSVAAPNEATTGRLISREAELADTLTQLETYRVVTLVGPGGVGKTRLATEIGRAWEDSGRRSVFVALEAITETELLLPRICETMGIRAETEVDLFAVLGETLRDQSMLLILDNFEQLIEAGGEIARLVTTLPHLRVLVTSRDRLRLSVERIVTVEPLRTGAEPDADPPASALFEQLARQADPEFELTDENRPTVRAICELVDGLPLAIGLATAQLRYLSLDYLRSHLEVNAGSMAAGMHDRPERQHSVSRLIGWSYQLLSPPEQLLLARLSVFEGGWSLAGARAVGRFDDDGEALIDLASLVDKSLIRSQSDVGAPRFAMLNLIDGYAASQLQGDHRLDAYDDHGRWVATMVRSIEEERWNRLASSWIDELNAEHANILVALRRAVDQGRTDLVCRIIGDLNMWWYRTGRHVDGRRWIEWVLANLDGNETEIVGRVHLSAGFMAFSDGDMTRARDHYELAIGAATEAGDWRYEQQALAYLSATSVRRPDESEQALLRLDGVIDRAERRQERVVLAHALNVSGVLLRFDGQPELARTRYEAALLTNRQTGDRYQEAMNLGNLAHLAGSIDDVDEALSFARAGLHVAWRIGSQVMSAWMLGLVAGLLQRVGEAEDAARLLSASGAVLDALGAHSGSVADQSAPQETRSALRNRLGDASFDQLTAAGRELTLEAAVELALVTAS